MDPWTYGTFKFQLYPSSTDQTFASRFSKLASPDVASHVALVSAGLAWRGVAWRGVERCRREGSV